MNTYKVDYEGHVYNYDKLAAVFEDEITVEAKSANIEDIQDAVEKHDGRTYGSFYLHRAPVKVKRADAMVIAPRVHKTDANDRAIIRAALAALINEQGRRLNRIKGEGPAYEDAANKIARARDLMNFFND